MGVAGMARHFGGKCQTFPVIIPIGLVCETIRWACHLQTREDGYGWTPLGGVHVRHRREEGVFVVIHEVL